MTLTPELIAQLATTFGPVGALCLIMWMNRPKNQDAENPGKEIVAQLAEMNARLIRVETILEERK